MQLHDSIVTIAHYIILWIDCKPSLATLGSLGRFESSVRKCNHVFERVYFVSGSGCAHRKSIHTCCDRCATQKISQWPSLRRIWNSILSENGTSTTTTTKIENARKGETKKMLKFKSLPNCRYATVFDFGHFVHGNRLERRVCVCHLRYIVHHQTDNKRMDKNYH